MFSGGGIITLPWQPLWLCLLPSRSTPHANPPATSCLIITSAVLYRDLLYLWPKAFAFDVPLRVVMPNCVVSVAMKASGCFLQLHSLCNFSSLGLVRAFEWAFFLFIYCDFLPSVTLISFVLFQFFFLPCDFFLAEKWRVPCCPVSLIPGYLVLMGPFLFPCII